MLIPRNGSICFLGPYSQCGLQRVCKYVELGVVVVRFQSLPPVNAVDDQFQTSLYIFHAHGIGLYLEFGECCFPVFHSIFTFLGYKISDFLPGEVKVVVVEGIEEPKLLLVILFDCDETEPVSCDCQHHMKD